MLFMKAAMPNSPHQETILWGAGGGCPKEGSVVPQNSRGVGGRGSGSWEVPGLQHLL